VTGSRASGETPSRWGPLPLSSEERGRGGQGERSPPEEVPGFHMTGISEMPVMFQ